MLKFYYDKDIPKQSDLKLEYLRKQVIKLHNTFQPVQKSPEWYEMRNGLLTASDWGKILDAKTDVLLKKCGEDRFVGGAAIDWGNKYEQVANMIYQHRNNVEVLEFGCLRHPVYDYLGASPDGITPDGVMVEIKCPYSRKITGIPKYEYWCQVQGQLEVCDLDRCDFIECFIKEYDSENEYLDDFANNPNEKGVIADIYLRNEKKHIFYYSKIFLVGEELESWKNEIVKDINTKDAILYDFCYWRLEEVSCIQIYRNQEWFYFARNILENYWNYIIKYRDFGFEQLRKDMTDGTIILEKMVHGKALFEMELCDKTYEKIFKKDSNQDKKKQKKIKDYDFTNIIDLNSESTVITINSDVDEIEDNFTIDNNVSMFSD